MKDGCGMLTSAMCIVHCLLAPVLVSYLSLGAMASVVGSEWLHVLFVFPALGFVVWSFKPAYAISRSFGPAGSAAIGILLLIGALFLEERWEVAISVAGASCLLFGHGLNRYQLGRAWADGLSPKSEIKTEGTMRRRASFHAEGDGGAALSRSGQGQY